MTKKYILLLFIVIGLYSCQIGKNSEVFTIYLVRHSEKELSSDDADPPLTQCGLQRSESLRHFLSDVPLDVVYSTDYNRTQNTARPTAKSRGLNLKGYNPDNLSEFSKLLIESKQNALVVGHSNTTGVLAGLLVGEEIGEFDLDIYDRVYQVAVCKKKGRLHLLHTSFKCKN